jgi:hypothetical protein
MAISKDQRKILTGNDFKKSAYDDNKYIRGGHSVTGGSGGTLTVKTDGHYNYPGGTSNSFLKEKTK